MKAVVAPLIYAVHACVVVTGYVLLRRWQRNATLVQWTPRASVTAAASIGLLFLVMAEPLREPFQDFVDAYYSGGKAIVSGGDVTALFQRGVHGYVNIPIVAVLFAPLALLPSQLAALLYLGLGVVATLWTFRLLARLGQLDPYGRALLALLMLTSGPLMNSLKEGNTSHFALLALSYALLCLRDGRPLRAGAALGCIIIFKLPLALFGVWALLRGRLRMAVGIGAVVAGSFALSVLVFGLEAHLTWYRSFVASASAAPLGAFNVQSFPAWQLRWEQAAQVLCSWDGVPVGPGTRRISSALSALLLGLCALSALWPALRGRGPLRLGGQAALELEFALVALLSCCTSPLAWSHYYCWALLPIALALGPAVAAAAGGLAARERATWYIAAVLVSLPVVRPWCQPAGPLALPYVLFTSHFLIGALVLIGLVALRRAREGREPARAAI
jgi:Glycosyltransferase family 87